jgi:hypothetical protein
MGIFYPQAAVTLKLRLEDYVRDSNSLDFYEFTVLAKSVTVTTNSYFEADTFECSIEYKNFPFDPRTIRACGVTVHAENMKKLYGKDGKRVEIVPNKANTIFQGFADEDEIKFDDSSRTVTLEGRDFTSLLIDAPYLKGNFSVNQKLDVAIQQLLSELPATAQLLVDNRVGNLPTLSNFWSDKQPGSGRKNVRKDQSYWDLIQSMIAEAGLIAYIELDKLVITKPRLLYDKSNAKVFIYGHNIKSLKFKRKLGRRKSFNLVVRSMNIESKKVLEAKIPEEATAAWLERNSYRKQPIKEIKFDTEGKPIPDADLKPSPYISFRLTNIANKAQLVEVGEELFEEIARQEIEGDFSTREMSIYYQELNQDGFPKANSQVQNFDVLSLRAGTPVAIVLDDNDLKKATKIENKKEREIYLKSRGYDPSVAAALSDSLGKYSNIFYTKGYRVRIDAQDGVTFDVNFINYIDVDEKFAEFTT